MITRKQFKTTMFTATGVIAGFFALSAGLPEGASREPLNDDLQAFEDVINACEKPATCKLPSLLLVPANSYTG